MNSQLPFFGTPCIKYEINYYKNHYYNIVYPVYPGNHWATYILFNDEQYSLVVDYFYKYSEI